MVLIGLVAGLSVFATVDPLNAAVLGLIVGTVFLLYAAICMLAGIAGYFEKTESQIKIAWAPEIHLTSMMDLIKAMAILVLSIAGLVVLWTVVAHHPWLYPYLEEQGII